MPLTSSIDLIYGQSSVTGITSTGFVLKILPAGVEIFSANIVYVKAPELSSSNRIGRFGMGMSQNIEEAGNREERKNTLTKKVRSTGSMNQGKWVSNVPFLLLENTLERATLIGWVGERPSKSKVQNLFYNNIPDTKLLLVPGIRAFNIQNRTLKCSNRNLTSS